MPTNLLDPPAHPDTLSGIGLTVPDHPGVQTTRETLTGRTPSQRYTLTSIEGGGLVVEVEGSPPQWLEPTINALAEMLRLPPNWDSYNARPISPRAAANTLELLDQTAHADIPPPQVVPTNRGGIQLEWHLPDIDLEIRALSPSRFSVSGEDFRTGEGWEDERSSDLTRLTEWLARLTRRG